MKVKHQGLRQVFKIVEWRSGCVYRTKQIGYAWVTLDYVSPDKDIQYHSVSTKIMQELKWHTNRTVSDDTPDVVPVKLVTGLIIVQSDESQ